MNKFKKLASLSAGVLATAFLLGNSVFAASYTVAPNDTLYTIGSVFNTASTTIMNDNKLSSSNIYPGEVLYVRADTYTVKSGDTMYLIAKKLGITLGTLRKANNKWDNMIYPGQKLVVPAIPAAAATVVQPVSNGTSVISYTDSDVDLLARLITAEADGEPYNAKVGVGAVIVNRVRSGEFASTIKGVIYQNINGYYQFTPVVNGTINKPATADARQAAYAALGGSDPVGSALFYFDDSTTNSWMWSKPVIARIGRMVFSQ